MACEALDQSEDFTSNEVCKIVGELLMKPITAITDLVKFYVLHMMLGGYESSKAEYLPKDVLERFGPSGLMTDVKGLFQAVGIDVGGSVLVRQAWGSYEYDPVPENNWLFVALKGFQELQRRLEQEGKSCSHFATVGTGPGIDAIGAAHIFKPDRVSAADIDGGLMGLVERNFARNAYLSKREGIMTSTGHLFAGLLPEGLSKVFDVAYGNLPNIPGSQLELSRPMARATFIDKGLSEDCPAELDKYLLALQYHFLLEAKRGLVDGGSAVIALGGRVPYGVIERLFESAGLKLEELCTSLKIQTQAKDVIGGYARSEVENGVDFTFYCHDEIAWLPELEQGLSGKDLKTALTPFALTANEALGYMKAGRKVAHLVHILRGVKAGS